VPHHVSLFTAQCWVDPFFNQEQLWPNPHLSHQRRVPGHLAKQEAALFDNVARAYYLRDEVSLRILAEAMPSLQRARKAREAIDKDGMTSSTARRSLGRIRNS
jgi:hypothetical protein